MYYYSVTILLYIVASQVLTSLDAYIAQSNVDNPPTPRVGEFLSYGRIKESQYLFKALLKMK